MCGFDLKLKILNKKGNTENNITTMKPGLPYSSQIQINLCVTLRAVKREVEEENASLLCAFLLC